MISTRARASATLTDAPLHLPPDPKIHQKSIKINENPWFLLTGTISHESWSMNQELWCKMYDFYAREGLRYLDRRTTPSTSGPQNPPKINKNPWFLLTGTISHESWSMNQESWCKMYDFYAREGLRYVNSPPSWFTSGPQNP